MAVYMVGLIMSGNNAVLEEYGPRMEKLVAKHGGQYIARTDKAVRIEGEGEAPMFTVIMEFPSQKHVDAWMNDPEYAELVAMRLAKMDCDSFLVEGV